MQGDRIVAEHPVLILMQLLQKREPGRTIHSLSGQCVNLWVLGKHSHFT